MLEKKILKKEGYEGCNHQCTSWLNTTIREKAEYNLLPSIKARGKSKLRFIEEKPISCTYVGAKIIVEISTNSSCGYQSPDYALLCPMNAEYCTVNGMCTSEPSKKDREGTNKLWNYRNIAKICSKENDGV